MNVLIISPTPTHPRHTGTASRIFYFTEQLKNAGHEVYFFYIPREAGDIGEMRRYWGDHLIRGVYRYPEPPVVFNKFLRLGRRIHAALDPGFYHNRGIDHWYDGSNDALIAELKTKVPFQMVIVERILFSKALLLFPPGTLKVIDTHDVFTDRFRVFLKSKIRPQWYSVSAKEEAAGLNRADLLIAMHAADAGRLAGLTKKKVIEIGHLLPVQVKNAYVTREPVILFVGSENILNRHGLDFFLREVFPPIKKRVPNARLWVAGSINSKIKNSPDYVKIGPLEDLSAIYRGSRVVINPVLSGTGLQIKSIEALAYGKPLVTMPSGGEGLESGRGDGFFQASSAHEFSDLIVQVLTDDACALALSQEALSYTYERYRENLRTFLSCFGPAKS